MGAKLRHGLLAESQEFLSSGGEVDQTDVGAAPLIDLVLNRGNVGNRGLKGIQRLGSAADSDNCECHSNDPHPKRVVAQNGVGFAMRSSASVFHVNRDGGGRPPRESWRHSDSSHFGQHTHRTLVDTGTRAEVGVGEATGNRATRLIGGEVRDAV